MMQTRDFLKNLFKTGSKPTQQNFADWLDSFWHKSDMIDQLPYETTTDPSLDPRNILTVGKSQWKVGDILYTWMGFETWAVI